jgi:hypothetical protein
MGMGSVSCREVPDSQVRKKGGLYGFLEKLIRQIMPAENRSKSRTAWF